MRWIAAAGIFLVSVVQAQDSGWLVGVVTEQDSGRTLTGAHVTAEGIATTTDEQGRYRLSLKAGETEVRISFVGFTAVRSTVTIRSGAETRLDITLSPMMFVAQPVTATATRGKERETPVSLSTLAYRELRERYTAQDVPAILSELPSTTFYSESGNNIGYTYLNIRGFDSRRIAVMVNGIPQNDPEDHNVYWLDMPDLPANLEDVQVQRGAGSAFYGPPAIGGSVNLVTRRYAGEQALSLAAGAGSYNTRRYSAAYASGLLGGHYAVRGRFSRVLSDGYRDRAWIDFTSYFLGLARYDASMSTELNVYGGPISDGLAYYGIPKADVRNRDLRRANPIQRAEEQEKFHQPHAELLHEWRLSPSLTVNNTLFYMYGDGYFDYDGSWAPYSYFRIIPAQGDPDDMFIPGAMIRAQVTNRQWGWLPRLTLAHASGTLIVGAEVRSHRSLHWGALKRADRLVSGLPADYRYYQYRGGKEMLSVYAHELYDLSAQLKVMADLQYAFNRYRLFDEKFLGNDFAVPYHFLNPRLGANYNLDDRWSLYTTVALTSREPRLKNLYDAAEASTPSSWGSVVPQFEVRSDGTFNFSSPLVNAETLFDIELGARYTSGTARASLNCYWMEFSNEIIKSGQVDRFGQPVTGNAHRTRHLGVELSMTVEPIEGLELLGNVTACRNRFIDHTDYSTGSALRLDGNPIAGFPDILANGRLTYRRDALSVSGSVRFVGRQYTDNFRNANNSVDPFVVCDGWVAYALTGWLGHDSRLEAQLHVTNMFDALYASYGEGDMFFVGAERAVYLGIELSL